MTQRHSPVTPLYNGIWDCLDAALTVTLCSYVTKQTPFPYLQMGEPTGSDDSCMVTEVWDCTRSLHIWSRAKGEAEAAGIMEDVIGALTDSINPLTVEGWHVIHVTAEPETLFLDNEGDLPTWHGIVRVQVLLNYEGA